MSTKICLLATAMFCFLFSTVSYAVPQKRVVKCELTSKSTAIAVGSNWGKEIHINTDANAPLSTAQFMFNFLEKEPSGDCKGPVIITCTFNGGVSAQAGFATANFEDGKIQKTLKAGSHALILTPIKACRGQSNQSELAVSPNPWD